MKVLMLCTRFSLEESDPWLTNELAESLQESGHQVTVVCLDWSAKEGTSVRLSTLAGVRVISLSPVLIRTPVAFVSKLLKWTLSSVSAYRSIRRFAHDEEFDLVIGFSPAVTMALPLLAMTRRPKTKSFLVQWDFFPHHHRQIGLLSSRVAFAVARTAETLLMRRFDAIGCMSPANVEYLRAHYRLRDGQEVCVLPIWAKGAPFPEADRDVTRRRYDLPQSAPIVVFGGQLSQGRGLEDLLSTAAIAEECQSSLAFLVIGSGPLESLVKAYVDEGHRNLIWIPRVPRSEYLEIIRACDLSLVCTVRDVDVPSFPSKTLDYLRVGLPIVASVEKTTDYGDFLVSQGVGISVEAGRPRELLEAIGCLAADQEKLRAMGKRGPACFADNFEVGRVSMKLLEMAGCAMKVV
ncbi:glycosyltransferase family 4 protein [Thauera sinica]|uniref:Glycosyltransferase family 4 protein n=1 Tax=Thauera sinica TaxID=2665146 RepID=A0ABW1APN9_9RHOO|nr:glycosyltransferase family 4 protein [Thauera sp. K11]ATE62279.1 glycosyltransferase WbuB [Thauera sp. K11]